MTESSKKYAEVIDLPTQARREWQPGCFDDLSKILNDVDQMTEGIFLEFGNRVQDYHGRGQKLSHSVRDVLHLLRGEDNENTLGRLQLMVERCSLWLDEAQTRSVDICQLLADVDLLLARLDVPMAGLRKVIKTLHSLRVSTRIESAKQSASGSAVMADSLKELGVLIQQKAEEIFDRVRSLHPLLEQSLESEQRMQAGLMQQSCADVETARQILASFSETRIETGQWTDRLKERSDEVTRNFGEMIAALQFQDITRQRLQHMRTVFGSLESHLAEHHRRFGDEGDADTLQLFGCICRLQQEQLELSVSEFQRATENLSLNLHEMTKSVVMMAQDTDSFSHATNASLATIAGNEHRFALLAEALRSIASRLEMMQKTHDAASHFLAEVCVGARDVAALVGDVEYIGEEIQLLAMNAAINAAHSHQEGAGLDIIAQNIHAVAEEASAHAETLATECVSVSDKTQQLQDAERENQQNSTNLGELMREAESGLNHLDLNCHQLLDYAGSVKEQAGALSQEVSEVVNTIDIKEVFAEKLAPVFERLGHLGQWANETLIRDGDASLEKLFQELELCYTMDSQRQIHERFVSRDEEISSSSPNREWPIGQDHGLGANVDLF